MHGVDVPGEEEQPQLRRESGFALICGREEIVNLLIAPRLGLLAVCGS
jgi:hypothetical protein